MRNDLFWDLKKLFIEIFSIKFEKFLNIICFLRIIWIICFAIL